MNETKPDTKGLFPFDYRVRHAIYAHAASQTRLPNAEWLADHLAASSADIVNAFRRLSEAHLLVLAPSRSEIWMAHPFSSVPTEYPVETERGIYFGNCVWDALAIPSLVSLNGRCCTRCPASSEPLELNIVNGALAPVDAIVHFAVPARKFWENVAFT